MFKITGNKGFHMTFENGVTISVQFGVGNYCENYNSLEFMPQKGMQSINAEIAIWDKRGNWITEKYVEEVLEKETGDDVMGYLTTEQVLQAMNWMKNYK